MNDASDNKVGRRPLLIAGSLLALAVVGGAIYEVPRVLQKRQTPASYEDLVSQLPDRDSSQIVGSAVLSRTQEFHAHDVAAELRGRFAGKSLGRVVAEDATEARLSEIGGWVLPESLSDLCGLSAKQG